MCSSNSIVDKINKIRHKSSNITINSGGQRIDNFLIKTIKGVPRSLIYKVIRDGQVRVNSKRVKPSYKLACEDIIRIPPISPQMKETSRSEKFLDTIDDHIIHENQDFLVINKPAGLAVHSGTNVKYDVISSLRKLKNNSNLAPVNRLDRNTSGCMLISKNYQSAKDLGKCFKLGTVKKMYTALLSGKLSKNIITVDLALKSDKRKRNGGVFVDSSGKNSLSTFHVKKYFSSCTLVNVSIQTGRTHQIRVHASSMNHPICGDTKYGDKSINTEFRNIGLSRIFLHSTDLSFNYKKQYSFKSPLPDDLSNFIENLENGL